MIPYSNAVLTSIAGGGTAEDYDTPAGAAVARWTGATAIYVAEDLIEVQTGATQTSGMVATQAVDEVVRDRVEIPYTVGALVQRGDTLTYTFEGATHTRTARNVIRSQAVNRVRVTLEDA